MNDYSKIVRLERLRFARVAVFVHDSNGRFRTVFAFVEDLESLKAFRRRCKASGVAFDGKALKPVWTLLLARLWREAECII